MALIMLRVVLAMLATARPLISSPAFIARDIPGARAPPPSRAASRHGRCEPANWRSPAGPRRQPGKGRMGRQLLAYRRAQPVRRPFEDPCGGAAAPTAQRPRSRQTDLLPAVPGARGEGGPGGSDGVLHRAFFPHQRQRLVDPFDRRVDHACRRRSDPSFSDITYAFNGGKSRYKALQAKVDWRVSRDVTLLSSLTLSVTKDNGGQSLETANGNNPTPQDFRNMGPDYGLSYYHQPYNSTTSFVWTLPFGHGKRWGSSASGLLDGFIGGWQLAGINSMFAGEPVTFSYTPGAAFVVSGIQQDFRGANSYRANVSCSNPYAQGGTQSISNWFDKSCVSVPTDPSQPFGNAQRNTVRGPMFWQFDLAASKRVPVGGPAQVELRVEAFNLLNRTNFRSPNGNRSANAFGTITSTYDPRQLQLGIKLLW